MMRRSSTRSGFTLLEVLLCLAIVGMLAGSVMAMFFELLSRREAISQIALRQQGAAALLERIEADLSCGLAGDTGNGAGINGTSERLVLLTRGVWLPDASRPAAAMGDLQGSEYIFGDAERAISARRWAAGEPDAGDYETICTGVQALRLRYFDGANWSESFNSLAKGGLPVAIEVALWFEDGGEWVQEERFSDGGEQLPPRDPDRVRLVIVPDGPVAAWKEQR